MKENNKLVSILVNILTYYFFEIRIRRLKWKIH